MSDRERTYTVRLRIIYNGHNAHLMHNPVCHCNQLYLDYNSLHQNLCTSVTLASFIHPRAVVCVSCAHTEFLSRDSVCITHYEKYVLLRNTEYVEKWYCYLCIGYIFF